MSEFVEKVPSVVQMFEGLTHVSNLEEMLRDAEKGIIFAALYYADDETIKKSRKDKSAMLPYILQVEKMDADEVAKTISFFMGKLAAFSIAIMPKDLSKKK